MESADFAGVSRRPSEGECDAASVEERERTTYEREKSSGAFSSLTTERSTVRVRRE